MSRWRMALSSAFAAVSAAFALSVPCHAVPVTLGSQQDVCLAAGTSEGGYVWETVNQNGIADVIFNPDAGTAADGLIQFDLSSVPSGSTVEGATLSLYHEYNSQNGISFDLYRVTSPWSETVATYANQPTHDPTVVGSLTIADTSAGVRRQWDVTNVVEDWISGKYPNYGLLIKRDPDASPWPYFVSKESTTESYRSSLTIDYNGGPKVPEPSSLAFLASFGVAATAVVLRRRSR